MDGIEATIQIKGSADLAPPPPVVLVTAHATDELARRAEAAGVDVFLTKPVSQSALWNAVNEAMGGGRRTRPAADEMVTFEGSRVLLVEDNDINRRVAIELLEAAGLDVAAAENGTDALSRLEREPFAAILMDIQMPGMDGLEATRRIRALARGGEVPIIALTAHAMAGDRERFLTAGMNDYVSKPIDEAELLAALARWLPHCRTTVSRKRSAPHRELPGLDLSRALLRVRGNQRLLKRLVRDFVGRREEMLEEIRTAISEGRAAEALALAHTLKGSAGAIAATRVAATAAEIECVLRDGGEPRLEPLADALAELVKSARQLDEDQSVTEAPPEIPAPTPRDLDDAALRRALSVLRHELETNGLAATAALHPVAAALAGRGIDKKLRQIEVEIDLLRYDNAVKTLRSIAHAVGIEEAGQEDVGGEVDTGHEETA